MRGHEKSEIGITTFLHKKYSSFFGYANVPSEELFPEQGGHWNF